MCKQLIILPLMCVLTACGYTDIRRAPDYANTLSAREMVILPPNAQVFMNNVTGAAERQYDYENTIEPEIARALESALREKGYRVRAVTKRLLKEHDLYHPIDQFSQGYNQLYTTLYPQDPHADIAHEEHALALNARVNSALSRPVTQALGRELLLVVNYEEQLKSSGNMATEMALNIAGSLLLGQSLGSQPQTAFVSLGMVEGSTGRVLWTHNHTEQYSADGLGDLGLEEHEIMMKRVHDVVEGVLEALPDKHKLYDAEG